MVIRKQDTLDDFAEGSESGLEHEHGSMQRANPRYGPKIAWLLRNLWLIQS